MGDDQWVILGEPKVSPTPKVKPVNAQTVEISNVTLTTAFVDAVTSKPEVEVTIESPILSAHENASISLSHGQEKIHRFGNSTGTMFYV